MSDYPVIPELPEVPVRNEAKADFSRKSSEFISALPALRTAINDAGAWIQAAMSTITGYVQSAINARDDASGFADDASGYADTAGNLAADAEGFATAADGYAQLALATANFKGEWDTLSGFLAAPASVYWDGAYWNALNDIADVALSEPGVSNDWVTPESKIETWTAISASATLSPWGRYRIAFPASPITLTLPAVAPNNTLVRLYRSSGSSAGSTINPNGKTFMGAAGAVTIDTNITALDLISTGTDWRILK